MVTNILISSLFGSLVITILFCIYLYKQYSDLEKNRNTESRNKICTLQKELQEVINEKKIAEAEYNLIMSNIDEKVKKEEEVIVKILQEKKEKLNLQLEHDLEKCFNNIRVAEQAKLNLEISENAEQLFTLNEMLETIQKELQDFEKKRESINSAILREREIQEKEEFFKMSIESELREDIEILTEIEEILNNKEVLHKLIYESFFKRPLKELIKRQTKGKKISGIYKITYIPTGEAYIGKTTDIGTRWQNHIKAVCGLNGTVKTTLHTQMAKNGIWNYTFEILEKVEREKLTEREKFYINLYKTDIQLNMRKG